jgi:hypothetical protein
MNQFILSRDPKQSAAWLCNSHSVKQPLEQAQMLSSCHRLLETPQADFVYKVAHANHPCTKWLRSSQIAYKYGLEYLEAMFAEYTHRYGKIHKTEREILPYLRHVPEALPDLPSVIIKSVEERMLWKRTVSTTKRDATRSKWNGQTGRNHNGCRSKH